MTVETRDMHQRNVREDLEWFYSNLDDQIDDLELEARGVSLNLYWDASEVRRAVLGAFYFFDPVQFDMSQFDDDRTMVACLAAQRWLGSIRMLEPHQAEFAKALRESFYRTSTWLTNEQLKTFFAQVALPDSEDFSLSKLGARTAEQREKLIAKYAGEAGRLFKAIQCAKGSWRNRLTTMHSSEVLRFDQSSGIDYSVIFGSKEFQALRKALDERRREKADNNIVDAVCLCLLQQQVTNFRDQNSKSLPRFFETTSTFRNALETAGLMSSVSYFDQEGNLKTILRGADYFLFRAAFNVRDERVHSPFASISLDSLKQIRYRIKEILNAAAPLRPEELEDISVNGRPITMVIHDLKHMWILERIWLPFIASDELKSLDEEEKRRLEGFRPDPSMNKIVDAAIEKVTRALGDNVSQFNQFYKLYRGIEDHAATLRKRYSLVRPDPERLYQISAVGRFGIPRVLVHDIEALLNGLILGNEDDARRESALAAKICIAAKSDIKARTIAVAVLWVLEFYSAILDWPFAPRDDFWFISIFAAASIEASRSPDARRGIRELEARITSNPAPHDKPTLATSLAYLYFHLWRLEGGYCKWRPDRRIRTSRSESELQQLADDSIRFARLAYESTLDAPIEGRIYILNILLFYVTEAGTDAQFQMAFGLADELIPWHTEPTVWQYRYDDSLARYFHRRLLLVNDPARRSTLKQAHTIYLQAASDRSPGDRDVAAYVGIAANANLDG